MIAVIDTGYFLERRVLENVATKGYVTEAVVRELKTSDAMRYLDILSFMIEVRSPSEEYVEMVNRDIEGLLHGLSSTDIGVVALTLELKDEEAGRWMGPECSEREDVCCFTNDNGIKEVLNRIYCDRNSNVGGRCFKMRCYSCFSIFSENLDFCKSCGHRTLTRVSVGHDENGEKLFLKQNYRYRRPKTLVNNKGVELCSADQREYVQYKRTVGNRRKKAGLIEEAAFRMW